MFMMSNVSVAQSNADNDSFINQQNTTEIFNLVDQPQKKKLLNGTLM